MKKWFAVLSAAVLCLSLTNLLLAAALCLSLGTRDGKKGENTAASSDTPANIVVDKKKSLPLQQAVMRLPISLLTEKKSLPRIF